jgi:Tfp pilus assembly protein PilF
MCKRLYPNQDHIGTCASMNTYATILQRQGNYKEAETMFLQILQMKRRLFAGDHHEIATSLNNYGVVLLEQDRPRDALPYYR